MESQGELLKKVDLCMSRNIPKLVIAMLVVIIIPQLIGILYAILIENFFASPATYPIVNLNYSALVPTVLSFSTWIIGDFLDYVFFVFVLILYREHHIGFWHLFAGFRDFKRVFFVSLFLVIITGIGGVIFTFAVHFGTLLILSPTEEVIVYLKIVVSFLLTAVLYVRYGFVWFLLYEQPDLKVRDALKQSAVMTKGERLNFIWFCIKSAGLYLPIYVAALFATTFVPQATLVGMVNFMNIANLLPLVIFLFSYVIIIRISIAFAAWYTSHNDSIVIVDNTSDTVIELSEPRTDDSSENTED